MARSARTAAAAAMALLVGGALGASAQETPQAPGERCPSRTGMQCAVGVVQAARFMVLHSTDATLVGRLFQIQAERANEPGDAFTLESHEGDVLAVEFEEARLQNLTSARVLVRISLVR